MFFVFMNFGETIVIEARVFGLLKRQALATMHQKRLFWGKRQGLCVAQKKQIAPSPKRANVLDYGVFLEHAL